MSYPIRTIELPCDLMHVQGGSFRLMPEGEFSTGQWTQVPRSSGPRVQRWTAQVDLVFPRSSGDKRFEFEVFVARLQGTAVAFRMFDPLRVLPRGVGAGVWNARPGRRNQGEYVIDGQYLIDGEWHIEGGSTFAYVGSDAARYADQLHLTGLVPSQVVLKAGDQISVGGNLYMVMETVTTDADGEVTVPIAWRLWKPALAGDRVDLHHPTGRFVLTSPDGGTMTRQLWDGAASLSAIEVPFV